MSFTFLWRVLNANCRVAISLVLCIELQQKSKEKRHRIIRKVDWSVIVLMSDWEVVCVAGASCMWSRLDKLRRAISRLPRKPLMCSFHRKHRTTFQWPCRYISHFISALPLVRLQLVTLNVCLLVFDICQLIQTLHSVELTNSIVVAVSLKHLPEIVQKSPGSLFVWLDL